MKKFLLIVFIIFPCCWSSRIFAQQAKISGNVTDSETKAAIIGASIVIKGKLTGTITDAGGNFALSTSTAPPLTLVISVVGYQKQEVEVSDETPLNISLSSKAVIMDEMVFSASR